MNARLFEELRPVGFAVAYRMLGSAQGTSWPVVLVEVNSGEDTVLTRPSFTPGYGQNFRSPA